MNILKYLPLSILLTFRITSLPAQWTPVNAGTTEDLYSVDYYSPAIIWIGSYNQVVKTEDGGAAWNSISPIQDDQNVLIFPAAMYDLALFTPSDAIGVGLFYTGNSEHILRTANGGSTWNKATSNFSVPLLRYLKAVDVAGNRAVAAGNNGRMAYSLNAGINWTFVPSGTTDLINDLQFASPDTVFAVGSNLILRSVNSGVSWTSTATGDFLENVSCDHATVYAGGQYLHKSTNYGSSFSTFSWPFQYGGALHAVNADILLAAGTDGLYVSKTGGQFWEKYLLPAYQLINSIDFFDANKGIAVGQAGYAIKTDNLAAAPVIPVSWFDIQQGGPVFCQGDSVLFNNQSPPGYTYAWYRNGEVFSTDYQAGLLLDEAGIQTVALVAGNANGADTSIIELNVEGHFTINAFTLLSDADTVCQGDPVTFSLPASQGNVGYQLRKGNEPLGPIQYGNGSTLVFPAPPISGTTTFNVIGTHTNACFIDSTVISRTIVSASAPVMAPFSLSGDTICYYDAASLIVPNSLPAYSYTWFNYSTGQSGNAFVAGTGATITIPLPLLNTTQTFAPRAVSSNWGCGAVLSPGKVLTVEKPAPYFSINTYNPETGEPFYLINTSLNPSGSYLWDFGADATPAFSNAVNPSGITYSSAGSKNIKLINTSPYGCLDSVVHTVNAIDFITGDSCLFAVEASNWNSGAMTAIQFDEQENLFTWYNGSYTLKHISYSTHEDSIALDLPYLPDYDNSRFLTKYNNKGIPQWTTRLRHDSPEGDVLGAVETDAEGNVYCAYFHGNYLDSLRIYSTDERYITIDPPHEGSFLRSVVVLKYDRDGIFQWYNTYLAAYNLERLAMKADNDGNLYVCSDGMLLKYSASGELLWSNPGDFSDIDLDEQGYLWTSNNSPFNRDIMVQKFDQEGNLLFTSQPVSNIDAVIATKYLKLDSLNNIYLAGVFRGSFLYSNDTISDPYFGGPSHEDVFLCKMKPGGQQEWFRQFKTDKASILKGIAVKDGRIMLLATNNGDTVSVENLPPLPFTTAGHFLYQTDSLGGSAGITKLYETTQVGVPGNGQGQMLCFAPHSDALALTFEFNSDFPYSDAIVSPYSTESSVHSTFIGSGAIPCFGLDLQEIETPVSYFLPSANTSCTGQSITFTDLSSNDPNTWTWSFPGGIPATSSVQHPSVVYPSPGTFTATLVASNGFGEGSVYSKTIQITALPDISITGDSTICEGSEFTWFAITADDPDLSFQWQDSTASHSWANIDGQTAYDLPLYFPDTEQSGNKYRCLVTGSCGAHPTRAIVLTVNALPEVYLSPLGPFCHNEPDFTLTNGSPAGGIYSGAGVVNGSIFSPGSVGVGMYELYYIFTDANGCTNTDTANIQLDLCTAVSDPVTANGILVYPNPFSDHISIAYDLTEDADMEIALYDAIGRKVNTWVNTRQTAGRRQHSINRIPGDYGTGLYLIKITIDGRSAILKLMKI